MLDEFDFEPSMMPRLNRRDKAVQLSAQFVKRCREACETVVHL
jgi:hypothetical protein